MAEKVWDAPTRWFHWINAALVFALLGSGYFFMYWESLGIDDVETKMAIKAVHSWIGYAFALNLAGRLVWAFTGSANSRWRAIVPSRASLRGIGHELALLANRRPVEDRVRSPISRLSATTMFATLILVGGSGLIRAGTDMYYVPLGPFVASFVAHPDVDPSDVTWRTEAALANEARLATVTRGKLVTGLLHNYSSHFLVLLALLHVGGVAATEVRQRSGTVSAMISGEWTEAGGRGSTDTETS